MKKLLLIATIALFSFAPGEGYETLTIQGKTFVKPSIQSALYFLNVSTPEWKEIMMRLNYVDNGYQIGCPYWGSGATLNGSVIALTKCPNAIMFTWHNMAGTSSIMESFLAELEPYYRERKESNLIYAFIQGEYQYTFTVMNNGSNGMLYQDVIVKKEGK